MAKPKGQGPQCSSVGSDQLTGGVRGSRFGHRRGTGSGGASAVNTRASPHGKEVNDIRVPSSWPSTHPLQTFVLQSFPKASVHLGAPVFAASHGASPPANSDRLLGPTQIATGFMIRVAYNLLAATCESSSNGCCVDMVIPEVEALKEFFSSSFLGFFA